MIRKQAKSSFLFYFLFCSPEISVIVLANHVGDERVLSGSFQPPPIMYGWVSNFVFEYS